MSASRLRLSPWWATVPILAWTVFVVLIPLRPPRHDVLDPLPDTFRVGLAAVILFGLCGLGVTRLLLPDTLRRHEALWVLPTGACVAGLALMVGGFCRLPFEANLCVVLIAAAAVTGYALWRHGPPSLRGGGALGWPLMLSFTLMAIAVTPMVMAMHFATVTGVGSDAHMAAGTANYLMHGPPTGTAVRQPVDSMPLLWKSKYPIYYAFAGVARLAGLETWQVLAPLAAVLLALAAIGMYLIARDLLGASVGIGALAMGFAGFDRMVLHTGLNPYFNQTWGYLAMPFALVLAWWLVRPGEGRGARRRTGALLAIFVAVCGFAYPLALPFALTPLAVLLWRERRRRIAEGRPVPRLRSLWRGWKSLLWIVPAVLILSVPLVGVNEKITSATRLMLDTDQSLQAWAADLRAFIPAAFFFNLPNQWFFRLAIGAIVFFAFRELRRHQPRALYLGLGAILVFGLYEAVAFRNREFGQYIHFKLLAFVAPLLLVIATVHVGRWRRWRRLVLVGFAVATGTAVATEIDETGFQLGKPVVALAAWADELPPDATIRIDMPGGEQLWGAYFLASRRVCSADPLLESDYPHVVYSRKADYVVVSANAKRPIEALGDPLHHNDGFALYRMNPLTPGPDSCSFVQRSRVTQELVNH